MAFSYEIKPEGEVKQRFDSSATTNIVLNGRDLTNKVAIVTGASSGIGLEITRSLAFHGASVVMACRDLAKTAKAVNELQALRVIKYSHILVRGTISLLLIL